MVKVLLGLLFVTLSFPAIAQDNNDYAFILKGRGNVFWKTVDQGIRETAEKNGIKPLIYNTDDDQTPEAQLNICMTVIERKPKVIVLGAATKAVGIECYKKARDAGIIVADVDGNVTVTDAKAAGVDMAFSVGSDNYKIGQQAATFVWQDTAKEAPKILIIEGLPGSIVGQQRRDGFKDVIAKSVPGAKIVASLASNWDRQKAMVIATDTMQREPDLDYIYSVSDAMSMGVVEAIRTAGKTAQVKLISVDGIADARKAVLDSRMAANVAQLPYLMGKRSVEMAIAATEGKIKGVTEYTPTPTLTADVLKQNKDPDLEFVR
jgi:D-allose transport system substrate-binding protein